MSRPRVSIAGLMGVVLVAGLGMAALRGASPGWAQGMSLLTWAVLGFGVLVAMFGRGRRRSFWVGFALFGSVYMLLAFAPWFATAVGPRLPTTRGLLALHSRMHPGGNESGRLILADVNANYSDVKAVADAIRMQGISNIRFEALTTGSPGSIRVRPLTANIGEFLQIGHALIALILGLIGGLAFARKKLGLPTPAMSN